MEQLKDLKWIVRDEHRIIAAFLRRWQAEKFMIEQVNVYCWIEEREDEE